MSHDRLFYRTRREDGTEMRVISLAHHFAALGIVVTICGSLTGWAIGRTQGIESVAKEISQQLREDMRQRAIAQDREDALRMAAINDRFERVEERLAELRKMQAEHAQYMPHARR